MFPRYNEKLSHYFIFNIRKGNYCVISCFYVKQIEPLCYLNVFPLNKINMKQLKQEEEYRLYMMKAEQRHLWLHPS